MEFEAYQEAYKFEFLLQDQEMHVAIERNSWRLPQDDVVQVVNPRSKIKDIPDVSIVDYLSPTFSRKIEVRSQGRSPRGQYLFCPCVEYVSTVRMDIFGVRRSL